MDYLKGGEVWDLLMLDGKQFGVDTNMVQFLAADLVNATHYIHSQKILHRDLKPENMIISHEDGHLRLVDFGTAKDLQDTRLNGPNFVGTPEYMAPEVVENKEATTASDLWAVGCIIYQMFAGVTPFRGESSYLTFLKIKRCQFDPPAFLPRDASDLIEKLLRKNPADRIRHDEIKAHPFFQGIDFNTHIHVKPPVPSLKFLAKRAIVRNPYTSKSFTSLPETDVNHLLHLLERREKLDELKIYSKFFASPDQARLSYVRQHGYVGLTQRRQGQWKEPFFCMYLADQDQLREATSHINRLKPDFVVIGCSGNGTIELNAIDPSIHLVPMSDYYSFWIKGVKCIMMNKQQPGWLEYELEIGKLCAHHVLVFGQEALESQDLITQMKENNVKLYIGGNKGDEDQMETLYQDTQPAMDDQTSSGEEDEEEKIPFQIVTTGSNSGVGIIELSSRSVRYKYYEMNQIPKVLSMSDS